MKEKIAMLKNMGDKEKINYLMKNPIENSSLMIDNDCVQIVIELDDDDVEIIDFETYGNELLLRTFQLLGIKAEYV